MTLKLKYPAERLKIDDAEQWVDAVLDDFETEAWGKCGYSSWREYANDRFGRPSFLDSNHRDFKPRAFQDALIWLYDGGLTIRDISALLHIPRHGLQRTIDQIESQYEEEE